MKQQKFGTRYQHLKNDMVSLLSGSFFYKVMKCISVVGLIGFYNLTTSAQNGFFTTIFSNESRKIYFRTVI